jgi:hypothetical protein
VNPFLLAPRERLADWKAFRQSITSLPEEQQLSAVARYWGRAPLSTIAYDAEDLSSWPTAWEMVSAGEWCRNSVAVGMEATLRLCGWDRHRMAIRHVRDLDICFAGLVLEIDGNRWLNYDHAIVVEHPRTRLVEMARWHFTGKFYALAAT